MNAGLLAELDRARTELGDARAQVAALLEELHHAADADAGGDAGGDRASPRGAASPTPASRAAATDAARAGAHAAHAHAREHHRAQRRPWTKDFKVGDRVLTRSTISGWSGGLETWFPATVAAVRGLREAGPGHHPGASKREYDLHFDGGRVATGVAPDLVQAPVMILLQRGLFSRLDALSAFHR